MMNADSPKNLPADPEPSPAPGNPSQFPVRHPAEIPVQEPDEVPDNKEKLSSKGIFA